MFLLYSLVLTIAFVLMLPLFVLRREKYVSGFRQRLGNYPEFPADGRSVIWLHCVSVGETNAARPLVDRLIANFPSHRLIVSTTTKTGQELARNIFADKAAAVIYFPFDWKFSVRRALQTFNPSVVLLMETEIWPRFIREAKLAGSKIAIVNGRLSERSTHRYLLARSFITRTLGDVDLALMQGESDARAIRGLGMEPAKIAVTGNIKFDLVIDPAESAVSEHIRERFGFDGSRPLIIAASTHSPEEKLILNAFAQISGQAAKKPRLMIVPRHPERFDAVAELAAENGFLAARRSASLMSDDRNSDVIILDSIGELRAVYQLADVVFVGGSLIPHGGQSVLEPAAAGKAVVTGPHTSNFRAVIDKLLAENAIIQIARQNSDAEYAAELSSIFERLLSDRSERESLGRNAAAVIEANRGSSDRTIAALAGLVNTE